MHQIGAVRHLIHEQPENDTSSDEIVELMKEEL